MSLAMTRLADRQANYAYKLRSHHARKHRCPKCGSAPEKHYVKNYSPVWRDAQVFCLCGKYVRTWDVPKLTKRSKNASPLGS